MEKENNQSLYVVGLTEMQKLALTEVLKEYISGIDRDIRFLPNNPFFPEEGDKREKKEELDAQKVILTNIVGLLDTAESQECTSTKED